MAKIISVMSGLMLLACLGAGAAWAAGPQSIAGLELGKTLDQYNKMVSLPSRGPYADQMLLESVRLSPGALPGLAGGELILGTCSKPGQLVRIKLKPRDDSRAFFERLLALYKKNFGEPQVWRGDPFHNHLAWKWTFGDPGQGRTTLELSHGEKVEETQGNSIKLTATDLWEEEVGCAMKSRDERAKAQAEGSASPMTDINELLPR